MRWRAWLALFGIGLVASACGAAPFKTATATASPGYVPWLALAPSGILPQAPQPSPMPPVPIPPGTSACTADQLQATWVRGGGATGHTVMPVLYRNVGSTPCVLEGYPDVAIFGAGSRELASAGGTMNEGTFFDQPGVVPILMEPGLPAAGEYQAMPQGMARENVEWFDCTLPTAQRIVIDLPAGGGKLIANGPMNAGYSAICDGTPPGTARSGVSRGQFLPTGIEWPPAPTSIPVEVTARGPATVKPGSTYVYFVTIQNTGDVDYVLNPCPDYVEILGPKQAGGRYALNCAPVGRVTPGTAVTFEMQLEVPRSAPAGPNRIEWVLVDGRVADPHVTVEVTISS